MWPRNGSALALHRREPASETLAEKNPAPDNRDEEPDLLLCAFCTHPITSPAAITARAGQTHHTRVNPAGIRYSIGCFQEAPGTKTHGPPSLHWTWFPEYSWQLALCAGCQAHLGWCFRSSSDHFYGLILDHLIERPRRQTST